MSGGDLQKQIYVGIATHDYPLIEGAMELIKKYNVPKEKYEFQMLYGVRTHMAQKIANSGHRMRVYVPYGADWFPYSIRRLAENPFMALHITKAIFMDPLSARAKNLGHLIGALKPETMS